jgi:mannose-1-phosphate guanylyltransferase
MRALLLSAGLGTRLRPLTNKVPKCLVDINGRPLLDYWLELLYNGGISEVLVNLHHKHEIVTNFLRKSHYPLKITTVYENKLLGTAGTILKNKFYFDNEPFMVIHADNLSYFNIKNFISRYENRTEGVEITMLTFFTEMPKTCGIVELDSKGLVCAFHEKVENPPSNLANGAVYIISPSVVDSIAKINKNYIDFSMDIIPKYINKINSYHNNIYHRDIGSIESLNLARSEYPIALANMLLS